MTPSERSPTLKPHVRWFYWHEAPKAVGLAETESRRLVARAGGGACAGSVLRVSGLRVERAPQLGGGDGCTMMSMYLKTLKCIL